MHRALAGFTEEERAIAHKVMAELTERPYLFATVTGTHHYGFTSVDSDIDVRGSWADPTELHLGFGTPKSHVDYMGIIDEREVDGVAFEVERFMNLVLKGSGNLIEELFSPIVLYDGGHLEELRDAVHGCLTKGIIRHYQGFFESCIKKLHHKTKPPEVKSALYATRIALSGIHLLRTGEVEAHLPTLNETYELAFVDEWISMKVTEHEPIPAERFDEFIKTLLPLKRRLRSAVKGSVLPGEPRKLGALNDLLVKIRLENLP